MPRRRLGTMILAILLLPAVIPVAKGSATAPNDVQAKIRAILRDQQEKQHIPGLSFVAVKDDKVWFIETMGLRDVAGKLSVTPDTVFPVGSCTKSFTSVAAGISQDRGILSLDDPPRRFLPWFHMADPEADALVTLRDMLCHRTGLKAYADLAAEPADPDAGRVHQSGHGGEADRPLPREIPVLKCRVYCRGRGDRKGEPDDVGGPDRKRDPGSAWHDFEPCVDRRDGRAAGPRTGICVSRGFQGLEGRAGAEELERAGAGGSDCLERTRPGAVATVSDLRGNAGRKAVAFGSRTSCPHPGACHGWWGRVLRAGVGELSMERARCGRAQRRLAGNLRPRQLHARKASRLRRARQHVAKRVDCHRQSRQPAVAVAGGRNRGGATNRRDDSFNQRAGREVRGGSAQPRNFRRLMMCLCG